MYTSIYLPRGQIRQTELIILGFRGHAMVDPPEGRAAEIQIQCAMELQQLRPIGVSII
jgi:hypothetical protein